MAAAPEEQQSMNPKIEVKTIPGIGGGRGLFAAAPIKKGEWIWKEVPSLSCTPRSMAFIQALPEASRKAYLHFAYRTGPDSFESLKEFEDFPVEEWPNVAPKDISSYMNHSCEPTCWFEWPESGLTDHCDLMVATRDIEAGEEITFDYGTSEDFDFKANFKCMCGTKGCRGSVTFEDWKLPEMQLKYHGHFQRHIAEKMTRWNLSSWWHFKVMESDELGRYLVAEVDIPAGRPVLVLPPNRLTKRSDVAKTIQCLQVDKDLFSCSLSDEDLDNFLSHSCDPNCAFEILPNYTLVLSSIKNIPKGTPISFDYETMDDDLVEQGVDFQCNCGSHSCKKHIIGKSLRAAANKK